MTDSTEPRPSRSGAGGRIGRIGERFWDLRRLSERRVVEPLLAGAGVATVGALAWSYTVDDAFIVGRYARRWASGAGYGFQDGAATDGVTGPMWVLPGALAELVGRDPVSAQKAMGLVAMAMAAFWMTKFCRDRAGGRFTGPLVAVLLVTQATLGIWGVAGLETGLATLALGAVAIGAFHRRWVVSGTGAFVLAWTRPETLAAAWVLLLFRGSKRAWALAIAGLVSVCLWRWAMFGHLLPLSVWAKGGTFAEGLRYATFGCLVTTGGAGLILAAYAARRDPSFRPWLAACGVHLCVVAVLGGDWMPGFRLLAPILPMLLALSVIGARRLALQKGVVAQALLAVCLLAPTLDLTAQLGPAREAGVRRRAAAPLARRLDLVDGVALVDIGYLRYRSESRTLDLAGVTDPFVARLPGGHVSKEIPVAYLDAFQPDVILLHSRALPEVDRNGRLVQLAGHPVERRLAASSFVRANYEVEDVTRYAGHYWYVWLKRRE